MRRGAPDLRLEHKHVPPAHIEEAPDVVDADPIPRSRAASHVVPRRGLVKELVVLPVRGLHSPCFYCSGLSRRILLSIKRWKETALDRINDILNWSKLLSLFTVLRACKKHIRMHSHCTRSRFPCQNPLVSWAHSLTSRTSFFSHNPLRNEHYGPSDRTQP